MKRSYLVGIIIGVVILAAGFVAPLLRSSATRQAAEAQRLATLAQRELHRHDYGLLRLQELADAAGLKEADLDRLVQESEAAFTALREQFTREINEARQRDRNLNLPAADYAVVRTDPGGVRTAAGSFTQLVQENAALLAAAEKNANAALQADRQTVGVAFVQGMIEFVKATGRENDARRVHTALADQHERVLTLCAELKLVEANSDLYQSIDVSPVVTQLGQDRDEITQLHAAAAEGARLLESAVLERQQTLEQVRAELKAARAEFLALEQTGFKAGDDQAFQAYRTRYVESSTRQRALQRQEQALQFGARVGAETEEEAKTVSGEPAGGEVLLGLEELQRRLAVAQERAARLTKSKTALEERIKVVEQAGQNAHGEAKRYAARATELRARLDETRQQADQRATELSEKETAALQTAQAAVRAFGAAQQAADKWVSVARDVKQAKDPSGQNERLKLILNDQYVPQGGVSAEATARLLAGRIAAGRIESLTDRLRVLQRLAETLPDVAFDTGSVTEALDKTRTEAIETIDKARQTYERLAQRLPATTKWIPQASLASAYYLLAKLDTAQAETHLSMAADALKNATEGREKSPYLAKHVLFRAHLAQQTGAPAPEEAPSEEDAGGSDPGDKPAEGE